MTLPNPPGPLATADYLCHELPHRRPGPPDPCSSPIAAFKGDASYFSVRAGRTSASPRLRDPYHRVDVRRSSRAARVTAGGALIAETRRPLLVSETNVPVRVYVPRERRPTSRSP
jgi:uncharacterized protein (DUF427 family)